MSNAPVKVLIVASAHECVVCARYVTRRQQQTKSRRLTLTRMTSHNHNRLPMRKIHRPMRKIHRPMRKIHRPMRNRRCWSPQKKTPAKWTRIPAS